MAVMFKYIIVVRRDQGMKRIMNPMAWYQDYSRLFCGLTQ